MYLTRTSIQLCRTKAVGTTGAAYSNDLLHKGKEAY